MTGEESDNAHLSDFQIDRLLAREMDGPVERAHIAACPACADRYGALERQMAAFADEAAQRRLAENVERRAWAARRRRWLWIGGVPLAAAAGVVLLLARPHPAGDLRAKGSLGLEVWVARHGGGRAPESLLPGTTVAPGDALRFRASTPAAGHIAVASVDASGVVSLYVPATADRLPAVGPGTTVLDGAIELDQTLGRERLIALLCSAPLASRQVIDALDAASRAAHRDPAALEVDKAGLGCAHASFWLQKVPVR
jgi:hypothetical protein